MKALILSTLLLFDIHALAEVRTARLFDMGKVSAEPKFIQTTQVETSDTQVTTWNSKIVDAQGKLIMTETAKIEGYRIIHQYLEQLQIGEAYELKVEGMKATFTTYKLQDGKKGDPTETKTVDIGDNFITGPATEFFLKGKWSELLDSKSIKVEFGVFELSRTVGFNFTKIKDLEKSVEVQMKPSNFFISALVSPLIMEFDKETKKLIRFKGRTPLRELVNGKWKAWDAEILYSSDQK